MTKKSFGGLPAVSHVTWKMSCRLAVEPSGKVSVPLDLPVVDPASFGGAWSLIDVV